MFRLSESDQESDVKPRTYVPTFVLEEKILELENLLKTTQFENESFRPKEKTREQC